MKLILILLLHVSSGVMLFSQYNPGAKQISLSNSDVALSNDVFSLFNNPAGLAQMNWREVGAYYSPSPFGFKELANGYIAYHEPFSFGSIAVGGMMYGFELYKETKASASFSYNYMNRIFAGAAVTYHTLSIQNYGNDAVFYLNAGGLIYLLDDLRWGFFIHNLNRASWGDEKNQIPVIFNTGFSFNIIDDFSLNASVEKDIQYNASLSAGIDYAIIEYLSLRLGFSNEPARFSAGIGINYSFINLDYAMFTHQDLGLTHQAGVIISFGRSSSRTETIRELINKK